jgi:endonuclease/exonuclease/phosphatase (EEP) superfamily protein YafD
VFGDFNTTKNFTIEMIEREPHLSAHPKNKETITREQRRGDVINSSTLDFLLSNNEIVEWSRLEMNASDNYPIMMETGCCNTTRRKKYSYYSKAIPTKEDIF